MAQRSAYVTVAMGRVKETRSRISFAVFIAVAAWVFAHGPVPLIWFLAVLSAQLMDVAVSRRMKRRPDDEPSKLMKAGYFANLLVNTVIYSSISIYVWQYGGIPGKLFAILTPAGALLNVGLTMDRAPRLLSIAWAPHMIYLLGLPLFYGLTSPEVDFFPAAFVSIGALLYSIHVMLAVRRMAERAKEIREARDLAEAESAKAKRANEAKSDFLTTMSHEIRTPMNAVVAAAGLLGRTELSRQQAEHVEMLTNGADMLMGLLNDVLDLSKIESGKLVVEKAEFALVRKLDAGVQLWRARAEEKGLVLDFTSNDLPQMVVTDPLRLQQIIFNLLSNAVKFTERGRIELRGGRSADGQTLWLEVEDTGRGIDEEACRRVFDRFEQGSAGITRQFGGSGLGLAISRRLAGLMGGTLAVTSIEGAGSTFRLEIPLVEASAHEPASAEVEAAAALSHGAQLLLAEDHEVNQRIVRLILEPLGVQITVAGNGAEAVEAAAARPFDAILMDMQMPVMGGVEAASLIRDGDGPNVRTPILAFTANALDEHRAEWAAVGVDDFLTKPVDMKALIAAVQSALARKGADRKAA